MNTQAMTRKKLKALKLVGQLRLMRLDHFQRLFGERLYRTVIAERLATTIQLGRTKLILLTAKGCGIVAEPRVRNTSQKVIHTALMRGQFLCDNPNGGWDPITKRIKPESLPAGWYLTGGRSLFFFPSLTSSISAVNRSLIQYVAAWHEQGEVKVDRVYAKIVVPKICEWKKTRLERTWAKAKDSDSQKELALAVQVLKPSVVVVEDVL